MLGSVRWQTPCPVLMHRCIPWSRRRSSRRALSTAPALAAKPNTVALGKLRHRASWWTRAAAPGPGSTLWVLYFHCRGQFCLCKSPGPNSRGTHPSPRRAHRCPGTVDGDLAVTTALAGAGPAPSDGLSPSALRLAIAAAAGCGPLAGRWGPGGRWRGSTAQIGGTRRPSGEEKAAPWRTTSSAFPVSRWRNRMW